MTTRLHRKTARDRKIDELRAKIPEGPHGSGEYRKGHYLGVDDDGYAEWEWVEIPCGEWRNGKILCDAHIAYYEAVYPQGWSYYPGDVCEHGVYVGGCGIDWICGQCEGYS